VAYAKAKRYPEAISSWEAALKLNPKGNKVKNYLAKAQVYLREEKEKK
jgi:tetratricopeptide (TPR) repeat protein